MSSLTGQSVATTPGLSGRGRRQRHLQRIGRDASDTEPTLELLRDAAAQGPVVHEAEQGSDRGL